VLGIGGGEETIMGGFGGRLLGLEGPRGRCVEFAGQFLGGTVDRDGVGQSHAVPEIANDFHHNEQKTREGEPQCSMGSDKRMFRNSHHQLKIHNLEK
jgi:hypothetical protein